MQSIVLLLAVLIGIAGGYFFHDLLVTPQPAEINKIETIYDAGDIVLPSDSVTVLGCLPGKGYTWIENEKKDTGPAFLLWNNKVVGIEYYLHSNRMLDISGQELDLFNAKINHMQFLLLENKNRMKENLSMNFYLVPKHDLEQIDCINASDPATPSAKQN